MLIPWWITKVKDTLKICTTFLLLYMVTTVTRKLHNVDFHKYMACLVPYQPVFVSTLKNESNWCVLGNQRVFLPVKEWHKYCVCENEMSSALCCQFKEFTCFCYTLHHYWCITQPVCICSMYVLLWSLRKLPDVNQAPNASPFPAESKVPLTGQYVWTCISKSSSGPSSSPSAAGFLLPVPFHNA